MCRPYAHNRDGCDTIYTSGDAYATSKITQARTVEERLCEFLGEVAVEDGLDGEGDDDLVGFAEVGVDFGEPVPLYRFFQVAINGGLLAGAVGAISLLSAAVFHRRAAAVGAAVTYLVVNYFVEVTATSWQLMKPFGRWTIFHYVNGGKVFARHVWPVSEMTVLLAVLVCAAVAGGIVWRRKDLRL